MSGGRRQQGRQQLRLQQWRSQRRPRRRGACARLIALLLLASLGALGAGCGEGDAGPGGPRHVVVVVLDATGAAHLSCYGGPDGLTPNLDRVAAAGRRFDRAVSNNAWTLPSTTSLHTGLLQERHGVLTDRHRAGDELVLLPERLAASGRATAGFVQMVYASGHFGLDRGFDTFTYQGADGRRRDDARLVADVLDWWDAHADQPTFLYLHFRRPHSPYNPDPAALRRMPGFELLPEDRHELLTHADSRVTDPDQLRPGEADYARDLYRANLATVDASLRPLVDRALEGGDTLLVVLADHGEAFGEHGVFGHGDPLHAEVVDIPLLVAGPGVVPGVDDGLACTVDLAPTLLAWTGVDTDARADGVDLSERLRGAPPDARRLVLSGRYRPGADAGPPAVAFLDGTRKFILERNGSVRLYAHDDRAEHHDLSGDEPALCAELAAAAAALREPAAAAARAPAGELDLPEDVLRDLEQLGYLR